jgi:hypothetical protein
MPALHHALLGASVVALAFAGLRLASRFAEGGLARLLAAAAFTVAAAVAEAMVLGLVALGGSTAALTITALATAAVAYVALPGPKLTLGSELVAWWRERVLWERALFGGLAGAAAAWIVWQLRYPALGFDTIHYHLPEMVLFVQGGHPGRIYDVLPGLPVGHYPLATEVTVGWAMGISRSFVPLILWPWITLALTAAGGFGGLRALGVPRLAAGLAAAALATNPWLLGWQSNGSITDPPALAWLVVCAGLVAMSRHNRALLVPAVVAAGLSMGGKTTVLPNLVLVLALGLSAGWRARQLLVRPLVAATAVATGVGAFWYLRNLVEHGSPFWPLIATPWGDPVPYAVKIQSASFLDHPSATVDLLHKSYINRFGGALIVLAAALLAPLAAPRRRVVFAALVVLVGLLLWAQSPITGINPGVALPETVFSTTRYALPVVAAACVALAFVAVDARHRVLRAAALFVFAAAATVNLVLTIRLHFPIAPSAATPIEGAVVGAFGAALVRPRRLPVPARALPVLIAVAATLLAIPAAGFLARHSRTGQGVPAIIGRRLLAEPTYRTGSNPVATTPAYIGPLAGDDLKHRLEAIPRGESCLALTRRATEQWLVIYGGPLGGKAPADLRRCLPSPAVDLGTTLLYRPSHVEASP